MSTAKPVYVSSSGTLTSQPITSRIRNWTSDNVTIFYLFFETLITPMISPGSFTNPGARPRTTGSSGGPGPSGGGGGGPPRGGGGGGGDGGGGSGSNGGSGGSGGGGTWRGNGGGGFMTIGDLSGGGTVDGCRATCG